MFLAERLGLDVTYWTDVDLHERPGLLMNHRALISLGHDEYWSSGMRRGALAARVHGVNLAFLGANDVYRHIRLVPSPLGKDRREINYKVASEDPMFGVDNEEVTSQWREAPVPRPESVLLGGLYQCNPVHADMVVAAASSWVFAGTGMTNGDRLPGAIDLEYDRVDGSLPTPASVQILAHSPLTCQGRGDHADVTYYTTRSGGGVIDMASQGWIPLLTCRPPQDTNRCNAPGGPDHDQHPADVRPGPRRDRPSVTTQRGAVRHPARTPDPCLNGGSGCRPGRRWAPSRSAPRGAARRSPSPSICCLERRRWSRPPGSPSIARSSIGSVLSRWDGGWYLSIVRDGYPSFVPPGSGSPRRAASRSSPAIRC